MSATENVEANPMEALKRRLGQVSDPHVRAVALHDHVDLRGVGVDSSLHGGGIDPAQTVPAQGRTHAGAADRQDSTSAVSRDRGVLGRDQGRCDLGCGEDLLGCGG